jgi:uncharacterized protein YndB with AHSA1/START domain
MHSESSKLVQPLIVERTFSVPVEVLWRAITRPEEMRRWYFELEGFQPQAGCEFRFVVEHEGHTYDHRCKVMEVVPLSKIAYTWRYHGHVGESLVTMELAAAGDQTKLKLTHTGLESFPQTLPFARQNFERGWTSLIGDSLKDYTEHLDREIYLSRDLDAPRELVWEALVNPMHVVNWWGPRGFTTTIEAMDFRVGGVWKHVMHGPDGVNYPNEKVFQEIVPQEKIVFSHGGRRENGPSVDAIATWTFDKLGERRTRVSLRLVFPSAAERDRVETQFGATEGGKETLARLGEYLAELQQAQAA